MSNNYLALMVGRLTLRAAGSNAPFLGIGDTSDITVTPKTKDLDWQDHSAMGGGKIKTVSRIDSIEFSCTISDISPQNIAIAARGAVSSLTGVTEIADEVVSVTSIKAGDIYYFARIPDLTKPITVTNSTGVTTYDKGDDYVLRLSGIEIAPGTAIAVGDLHVTYTPLIEDAVDALVGAQKEFELYFEGQNEAADGLVRVFQGWKWKPNPSATSYIDDKPQSMKLVGELLRDDTKAIHGDSFSRYYRDRLVRPAA